MRCSRLALFLVAILPCQPLSAQTSDLNTQLVLSTFKIANPKSTATVFFLSRPAQDDPQKTEWILVTADHVFRLMEGDEATINFRKKGPDEEYTKVPLKIKIRQAGKALWTKHPSADVAVMVVTPPSDVSFPRLGVDLLATDVELKKYEIHPGDTIHSVGYPHANQLEANAAGFPIMRRGCIASFPLTPTKKTKTFLFDYNSFEGDSGGPVFLAENNRFYGGKTQEGRVQLILGLVSEQHWLNEEFKMVYQSGILRQRLGLGIVVHAAAIKETIDLLPRHP